MSLWMLYTMGWIGTVTARQWNCRDRYWPLVRVARIEGRVPPWPPRLPFRCLGGFQVKAVAMFLVANVGCQRGDVVRTE